MPVALKRRVDEAASGAKVSGNVWAMRCIERRLATALVSAPDLGRVVEKFVGVRFKMRDGAKIVDCLVSTEALEDRAARDGQQAQDDEFLFDLYLPEIARQFAARLAKPRVTSAGLAP